MGDDAISSEFFWYKVMVPMILVHRSKVTIFKNFETAVTLLSLEIRVNWPFPEVSIYPERPSSSWS